MQQKILITQLIIHRRLYGKQVIDFGLCFRAQRHNRRRADACPEAHPWVGRVHDFPERQAARPRAGPPGAQRDDVGPVGRWLDGHAADSDDTLRGAAIFALGYWAGWTVGDLKTFRQKIKPYEHWIMLGIGTAQTALAYGADDLDGTVRHEQIYHDAGATTPEMLSVERIKELIRETGREPIDRDTLYVDELIGPDTVNTLPETTIAAFEDHGTVARTIDTHVDEAAEVMRRLAGVGIDMDDVGSVLEEQAIAAFEQSFKSAQAALGMRLTQATSLTEALEGALAELKSLWRADRVLAVVSTSSICICFQAIYFPILSQIIHFKPMDP